MATSILGSLAHADPAKAKQRILHALERAAGSRTKAAQLLEIQHRSFYRIVERLNMWDEIEALIEEKGFQAGKGPPRSATRIREAVLEAGGNLTKAARMLDCGGVAVLRERIEQLQLWPDLNRALRAAGLPVIERTAA